MMTNSRWDDYFNGFEEYISEITGAGISWSINVVFDKLENLALELNFSPLEQAMLVDNILDNAQDANAKNLTVVVHQDEKSYFVDFRDDGDGLSDAYNGSDFFNAGITTTKGSGIGLSHIKQIVEKLEGEISISNNSEFDISSKGCTIRLKWLK